MKLAVVLSVLLVIVGQYWLHTQNVQQIQSLEDALAASQAETVAWKKAAEKAEQGNGALRQQAQACLDREAATRAEIDQWQIVLEQMESRPMETKEAKEVPDDATRKALCTDLDRPL